MYYIAIILYHFHEYKENKREICILQVLAAVLATLQDLVTLRPRNNIKNCIWQKNGGMPPSEPHPPRNCLNIIKTGFNYALAAKY